MKIKNLISLVSFLFLIMKQSSGAGRVPPDESMAQQKIEATAENNATSNHSSQQKIEATAENNAASNHSSGYRACVQRNRECIEKGTDAQVFSILYTFSFSFLLGVDASLDSEYSMQPRLIR